MKNSVFLMRMIASLLFLIGAAVCAVGASFLAKDQQNNLILNICLIVGGAVCIILSFILLSFAKKKAKKCCKKCGHSLNGCAYEWVLNSLDMSRANDMSFSSQIASYDIKAICPHCGAERTYHQEFVASDFSTGTQKNTQVLIENWCKEMFGH